MPSRVLLPALALHVPALAYAGAESGAAPAGVALACALVAGLGALGAATPRERLRTLGPVLGLLVASACYAVFTGRVIEARLHAVVVLAFAAVPRDVVAYGISAGVALATQTVAGVLAPLAPSVERGVADALFSAGFLVAASFAHLLWWRTPPAPPGGDAETSRALSDSLREVERVKTELIAVVSHEFRTPLTSIRGFAQTLERRVDQMDRRTMMTCVRSIDRQARRLERIVANLLAAAGNLHDEPGEAADVACVVTAVVAELDAYPGTGSRRIEVDVEPGLAVRAGAEPTARVLENLIDNALKFGDPGTRVRVTARREGRNAVLEVADLGPPIREGDLERIFDPFVQADSSDSRSADGIGLGLAIVSGIVAAYGGRVEARNTPPEVVLTVTLPAVDVDDPDPASLQQVGAQHG